MVPAAVRFRRGVLLPLLTTCLLGIISRSPAFGQIASSSLSGVIADDTGGALPGATVTITNKANGVTQTAVAGPEGRYRVVALPPALYEIVAELAGFGTAKREITLFVGTDATADFR